MMFVKKNDGDNDVSDEAHQKKAVKLWLFTHFIVVCDVCEKNDGDDDVGDDAVYICLPCSLKGNEKGKN